MAEAESRTAIATATTASGPSGARVGKGAEKKRQASKQDDQVMGVSAHLSISSDP